LYFLFHCPYSVAIIMPYVSSRRYSPCIKYRSRRENEQIYKVAGPYSSEGRPELFYGRFLAQIYCPQFSKVQLSYVCWPPSAKPGNEVQLEAHSCHRDSARCVKRPFSVTLKVICCCANRRGII